MSRLTSLVVLLSLGTLSAWAAPRTLIEWRFDQAGDLRGWGMPNHVTDLRAEAGALQGRIADWDPFVRSPQFEVPATPWQYLELRLRTDNGGDAEVFWTNTTESPYAGFMPEKATHLQVIGDGQWHDYRIWPFWQSEGKIILLRLDLPRPPTDQNGKRTFAVEWLRIVELEPPPATATPPVHDFRAGTPAWTATGGATARPTADGLEVVQDDKGQGAVESPLLRFPSDSGFWMSVEMAVDKGTSGAVRWVSSKGAVSAPLRFPLRADGQVHVYNVDMSASSSWDGDIHFLYLQPSSAPGARAVVRRVAGGDDPIGPADLDITSAGLENAVNRAAPSLPFLLTLVNRGGTRAANLRLAAATWPAGVSVVGPAGWQTLPAVDPGESASHRLALAATGPVSGPFTLTVTGDGAPVAPLSGTLRIDASPNLPKADYVPEPHPVETDYEIGAFYFPGWPTADRWEPIQRVSPERKPVLGWYDEANPECADWQIKWAVENGIRFFMVDWYWSAGNRHLDHWVEGAYQQARYRKYLKWCMMWANHNPPNTHSEEDQRAVTQYWLEHYFKTPDYYRIDDRPVVIVWSVANMRRDMEGKGGAKRLLDISQEMVKAAGLKGIYFVGMKWPEAATDGATIRELQAEGFEMTSIYHYMHHGGKATDPLRFPFDLTAASSYDHWQAWREAAPLPFLPNLSTGWDSRPWHGDKSTVIYGRTVPLFRRICEDAKRFADETGVKRLALAPLNEWGEGSYLEPCREFGFEMYETVRDVFARKPAGGWPQNLVPADVGRGPYDLPAVVHDALTAWDFRDSAQGWSAMMGVGDLKGGNGELSFVTSTGDPALSTRLNDVRAKAYTAVVIRMRVDAAADGKPDTAQLFWSTPSAAAAEAGSVKQVLIADGQFHDYVFAVGDNPRWRGRINSFRFDPCSRTGARVALAGVRLSTDGK